MSEVSQREPAINIAPVVLAVIGLMLAIHGVRVFFLSREQDFYFILHVAFIPLAYQGDVGLSALSLITSPVTYAFVHASWAHAGINSLWLVVFGAPLAARIGASRFLAFFVVTAIAAAFMFYAFNFNSTYPLTNASGAVSGLTAAAARFGFSRPQNSHSGFVGAPFTLAETFTNRTSLSFILIWFALNFLPAIIDFGGVNIAWEAHIGGFMAGLLLLPLFDRR